MFELRIKRNKIKRKNVTRNWDGVQIETCNEFDEKSLMTQTFPLEITPITTEKGKTLV